ncbi:hypothetical protein BX666DRAFT_1969927 [Dichotomocladium elegans]|nr:hypothetical protein BX666DRAFT_1969927 [Dichotomocladium elegans]
MATFSTEQQKIFITFEEYPWDADGLFWAGLSNILENLPPVQDEDDLAEGKREERQLLRAKHFFFSRFNQAFDLGDYIRYRAIKSTPGTEQETESDALFRRLEEYDYDQDEKYLAGLASIIDEWVQQQTKEGAAWDKLRMDDEFKKTKADYYAKNIAPVDLDKYSEWLQQKKQANQPACPFAHVWKYKNTESMKPATATTHDAFVMVSKTRGATTLLLASPGTNNAITVGRLEELKQSFISASKHSTSLILRVASGSNILSSGLAYDETIIAATTSMGGDQKQILARSLDKLEVSYYSFIETVCLQQVKNPTIIFISGRVPLDTAYLFMWHGFTRVITEHTILEFGISRLHAPVPPLLLMLICRQRMAQKKPLPKGMELYLALAPPELVRLRGPELLRLGLADIFVPEGQLDDTYDTTNKMSICPAPKTVVAIQLALASAHTYPGPDRLDVWENEITRIFGDSETLDEIQIKLEAMDSQWSTAILAHWKNLPPSLLEVVFRAVAVCSDSPSPAKILELERSLNARWRRSKNYALWQARGSDSPVQWVAEDVDAYFDDETTPSFDDAEVAAVVYELPKSQSTSACPITGQRSSAGCPIAGKSAGSLIDQACPVTGYHE